MAGRLVLDCCIVEAGEDGIPVARGSACERLAKLLADIDEFAVEHLCDTVEVRVGRLRARGRLRLRCIEVDADRGVVRVPVGVLFRGITLDDFTAAAIKSEIDSACWNV